MDKVAGLKQILESDPKNSFARYGLAMELAGCGDIEASLAEFSSLLAWVIQTTPLPTLWLRKPSPMLDETRKRSSASKPASNPQNAQATTMPSVRCRQCSTNSTAEKRFQVEPSATERAEIDEVIFLRSATVLSF